MAVLSEDQKAFIVRRLACYATPSEVVADVTAEYGITIPREQVRKFNPEQCEVALKWKALHKATREAFLASVATIDIGQLAFRVKEASDHYRELKRKKNILGAMSILNIVQGWLGTAPTGTGTAELPAAVNTVEEAAAVLDRGLGGLANMGTVTPFPKRGA